MFTGIIEKKVAVCSFENDMLTIENPWPSEALWIGQSIAVNGCCLTLVKSDSKTLTFQVSSESLEKTTLSQFKEVSTPMHVNLEQAMKLSSGLDGHMVSGHIDGVAEIESLQTRDENYKEIWIKVPQELLKNNMLVEKGSIAIDGVSLTINEVKEKSFSVMVIPKTLEITRIANYKAKDQVNIEFDMLGKYILKNMKAYLTNPSILEALRKAES